MHEAANKSRNDNTQKRYRRIQLQYVELMREKTESGLSPSSDSVIRKMADTWCFSVRRIERILKMELPETDPAEQLPLDLD